jgi:uncharacterized protein YfaA (DUF2138 family)
MAHVAAKQPMIDGVVRRVLRELRDDGYPPGALELAGQAAAWSLWQTPDDAPRSWVIHVARTAAAQALGAGASELP